jgi:hypothetical protein
MIFDLSKSPYEVNPELNIHFQETPTSMWGHLLYAHPDSPFDKLFKTERLHYILQSYPDFILDEAISKKIYDIFTSKQRKFLSIWEDKLEEQFVLLQSTPTTLTNVKEINTLMANFKKLWEEYRKLQNDSQTINDRPESLLESNQLY